MRIGVYTLPMINLNDAVEAVVQQAVKSAVENALAPYIGVLDRMAAFLGAPTPSARKVKAAQGRALDKLLRKNARRTRRISKKEATPCGVIGCKRPSASKGYCISHYYKRRKHLDDGKLPVEWVEFPSPQSITDFKLRRGRAAAGVTDLSAVKVTARPPIIRKKAAK